MTEYEARKSWLFILTLITIIICSCILKPGNKQEITVKAEWPNYSPLKIDHVLHNR